ncbi:MAG: class A beta-lactamase [Acidobacteria bacterium]|nr:class A beta-lactamase [Acidobacteriota bacterium]
MLLVLPLVLLALASPAPDSAPPDPIVAAARAVETGGLVAGVSVLHLESGRAASWRGTETFQMASVFKLPVAIAVLDSVERGKLSLDQEVEVKESDRQRVGPIDDHWTPGMRVSVARMVDVMLVDSDNTAADLLIRLLGGPAAVEQTLVSKGVSGIRVSLDEKGLGAAMQKDLDAIERGAQNGTTPDAMAGLLARLFKGELLSKASTDRILDSMRRCATSGRRFRAGLPKGAEVFDKTGTMRLSSNDVGILTLPDGSHAVLAVFTRGGTGAEAREKAIASIAKAAWAAGTPPR